jgi:filamentous hemagglutinin
VLWRRFAAEDGLAATKFGDYTKQDLVDAANPSDRNGLTQAGRALQKHSGREGSFFYDTSTGSAAARNEQGLQAVLDIIDDPAQTEVLNNVINIWGQEGQRVRYNINGSFMGFLEPVP